MVDGITIVLDIDNYNFPIEYDSIRTKKQIINNELKLPNKYPKHSVNNHEMSVIYDTYKSKLTISNSLRKWYFGYSSLEDFTIIELVKALNLLANKLAIKKDKFYSAKVIKMEFGKNLFLPNNIKLYYKEIYSKKPKIGWAIYPNFIRLESTNFDIKLYDKVADILDKLKKNKRGTKDRKRIEENLVNLKKDKFVLRYEIVIKTPLKFLKRKNEGFYVKDIELLYSDFLKHWIKKANKLQFDISTDKEIFTEKDLDVFLMGVGIEKVGIKQIFNIIKGLENKSSKQKSRLRKEIIRRHKLAIKKGFVRKTIFREIMQHFVKEIRLYRDYKNS